VHGNCDAKRISKGERDVQKYEGGGIMNVLKYARDGMLRLRSVRIYDSERILSMD